MVEGRWAGTVATGSVAGFISWSPAVCHSLLCSFQRCQFCLEASSPSATSSAHASQTRHTFISLILLPIVFKDFIFPVLVASGLYTVSVILITIFYSFEFITSHSLLVGTRSTTFFCFKLHHLLLSAVTRFKAHSPRRSPFPFPPPPPALRLGSNSACKRHCR